MVPPLLTLASTSPRRSALLRQLSLPFDVVDSKVDEASIRTPAGPAERVRLLARAKALAVVPALPGRLVLAADTLVVLDDVVLGKPADPADAVRMLQALSGRTHVVNTGVALVGRGLSTPTHLDVAGWSLFADTTAFGSCLTTVVTTAVTFRRLSDGEIAAYVATGEPLDKAGAYGIQGGARSFVAEVRGCYTNVVGLPICLVARLLREAAEVAVQAPTNPNCQPAAMMPCHRGAT